MKFSILGSTGFIGSNLVKYLNKNGFECNAPDIRKHDIFNEELGNVVYCLGVSNFIKNLYGTVDAHVCILRKILERGKFDSFLYLSSARIYYNNPNADEESNITVNPSNLDDLYNISKIMGESICFASGRKNVRIVRPSNVTGNNFLSQLFIPSLIRDAVDNKKITLHSTLDSEKDYVFIDDVVDLLCKISQKGKHSIYNLASGFNTPTKKITDEISRVTNCNVDIMKNAKKFSSTENSIERIKEEFNFRPSCIIDKLENMIKSYQEYSTGN